MNIKILTDLIKSAARETGFDVVGIVKPASLEEGERAIEAWVSEGRHGSMKYLEEFRARRARFLSEFGEVKSVIVLGVNYYSNSVKRPALSVKEKPVQTKILSERFSGRVARYAWGKDYHQVIAGKHEKLITKLRGFCGTDFQAKSCVDTQPVHERTAAVQAGFGFAGKHTGLLNQRFGPWLFLSEITTNLELEEDVPDPGTCGTCTHCQSACPTGALDQDYRMDARRCIAYLTIEHKGPIPHEFRTHIKDWIFGCDECLVVCPFTSKSQETSWKEFRAEEGAGPALNVAELFEIRSNRDYEKRFRGTALLRAGRKQMLRNACLVLGNSGDPAAIPYLAKALEDPAPLVRQHAAWGLGRFGGNGSEVTAILQNVLTNETHPDVVKEIRSAIEGKFSGFQGHNV